MDDEQPWIPGALGGGTGFAPRAGSARRSGAVAEVLEALATVRFPASREEVLRACEARPGCARWLADLARLPNRRFANAHEVGDELRAAIRSPQYD